MADSILQNDKRCYFCGSQNALERHHIFGGTGNRKISEKYGFVVWLCHFCHNEPPNGVHFNRERMNLLRKRCQVEFERTHTRQDFMNLIGKNYIME